MDERSGLATVGAGITGPDLATELAARGLTIGHEPQSWELATVGGWVAARGSGLRSLGVGRIEQLYAGGTLEAPAGTLDMAPYPASAAGPDLRQLVLGSEGRLGFLTDVILRATPLPETERMEAWALPGWGEGQEAVRELAQARAGLSLLRLSTPAETQTLLAFADRPSQTRALTTYLRVRRRPSDWVLLLVGVSGRRRIAKAAGAEAASVLRQASRHADPLAGERPGTGPASARRTCATRCGPPATGRTPSRRPRTGRTCPCCSRASRRASPVPSRPSASGRTCSRTSRTCTRRGPAST